MDFAVLLLVERPGSQIDALVEDLRASGLTAIYGSTGGGQSGGTQNGPRPLVYLPEAPAMPGMPPQADRAAAVEFGLQSIVDREKNCQAIVLVDTRRGYRSEDILAIAQKAQAQAQTGSLVVGERITGGQAPFLTRLAGALSRQLARIFMGVPLNDLRSGLLVIPACAVPALVKRAAQPQNPVEGEFELELILAAKRSGFPIHGHFVRSGDTAGRAPAIRLILNSMSLYFVLARYISSSLLTAVVDNLAFLLCYPFIHNLLASIYLARLLAVLVNYFLLRKVVFYSSEETTRTFLKYIALVFVSGLAASLLILFFNAEFHTSVMAGKIMAELILYFVNFAILNRLVFVRRQPLD